MRQDEVGKELLGTSFGMFCEDNAGLLNHRSVPFDLINCVKIWSPMARSATYESLLRARELIDAQYTQPLELDELARTANFSRYHFLRAFRRAFHATPHEYLTRKRIERAKELLAESELTVTEICFEVGFESLGSFSTLFHKITGWSPSIYRARAWEMRRNPLKFIPNCYVIMHGIQVSDPKA